MSTPPQCSLYSFNSHRPHSSIIPSKILTEKGQAYQDMKEHLDLSFSDDSDLEYRFIFLPLFSALFIVFFLFILFKFILFVFVYISIAIYLKVCIYPCHFLFNLYKLKFLKIILYIFCLNFKNLCIYF